MCYQNRKALLVFTFFVLGRAGFAAFLPVCERTEPVRKFLEGATRKVCADIQPVDLLDIKRVSVAHTNIAVFKADDFTGLSNLEILNIRSNPYTTLPEGLMKDLVNLKTLVIIGSQLRYYPDDFLQYNPLIENLHIFGTNLASISESIFDRLANAKNLKVIDFDAALQPAEQKRLLQMFPVGGKVELSLI